MPKVVITDECARVIRGAATLPFRQTGTKLPNGDWSIPMDIDVYTRLKSIKFEGETLSDTIMRAIAAGHGLN